MKIKKYLGVIVILLWSTITLAQITFKEKYKTFYDLLNTTNYYDIESNVTVFKGSKVLNHVNYMVKRSKEDFFVKLGDTERIYNEYMVITMNLEMKSIILTERNEEEVSVFKSGEYFLMLDSLSKSGKIDSKVDNSKSSSYQINLDNSIYKKLEVAFEGDLLKTVKVYYADPEAPYDYAELEFNFYLGKTDEKEDYFSISRYALETPQGYQLRKDFKDFELSLY